MPNPTTSWYERVVSLQANTVLPVEFSGPVNLVMVRNPSGANVIYIDLKPTLRGSDYETYAQVDGWGVLSRPFKIEKIYLLAAVNIPNVRVYAVWTEAPLQLLSTSLKPVTSSVDVVSTVGLKAGDLNLDATKDLQVDVKTLPSLPAGTNNIGDVDVVTLPDVNLAGVTAVKVSAAAAGDVTVKAAAGKVFAIRAGTANVVLKDGTTERWSVPSGAKDEFPQPIACGTSIILNFAAAGDAWILYL